MKQPSTEWPSLLAGQETTDNVLLKDLALVLSLGTLGIIMLVSIIYVPLSISINPIPVDPASAVSVEGALGAEYVLQNSFVFGRYLLPLLVGIAGTVGFLVYALRAKSKKV